MARRPRRKGGTLRDGERRQLAYASRRASTAPRPVEPSDRVRVLCDGGSRGNPGPAAVAAVLVAPGGELLDQRAAKIGRATAADAEYRAILLGLELARRAGAEEIEVRSDSRLAIAAIEREAGHRAAAVRAAARGFSDVRWRWQPRRDNELADALVRGLLWPRG